jgi:hypothetical protein
LVDFRRPTLARTQRASESRRANAAYVGTGSVACRRKRKVMPYTDAKAQSAGRHRAAGDAAPIMSRLFLADPQ